MNYDVAKKLKDAGFPQKDYLAKEQPNGWIAEDGDFADWKVSDEYIYVPTLSELIEAMPMRVKYIDGLINDAFFILEKLCGQKASYRASLDGDFETEEIAKKWQFVKDTPEEAVANLWLALNPVKPLP